MNSDLVGRRFKIPEEKVKVLRDALAKYGNSNSGIKSPSSEGKKRCERLIRDQELTYAQIKRMLHDMTYINKLKDPVAWKLNGGDEMFAWIESTLEAARREVESRKESEKNANEIGGLDGIRKNAYLDTHEKNPNNKNSVDNILFNNNDISSITPMVSEQIERINNLINQTKT